MDSNTAFQRQPVSFVRRGNRLQGRRQRAWTEHGDQYRVEVPRVVTDTSVDPNFTFDAAAAFGRVAPLTVEVGSGLGEAIVAHAKQHPERDYLAVEVYLPGLAQTVQRAASSNVHNIRLVQANAPEVFATMLPAASVAEVWTFFPDPWPKSRHEKRRLVTSGFAELIHRALVPGGRWRLATDWEHYAEQMLATLNDSTLHNQHQSWAPRYAGRIMTSFENKGIAAGRTIRDLEFSKID